MRRRRRRRRTTFIPWRWCDKINVTTKRKVRDDDCFTRVGCKRGSDKRVRLLKSRERTSRGRGLLRRYRLRAGSGTKKPTRISLTLFNQMSRRVAPDDVSKSELFRRDAQRAGSAERIQECISESFVDDFGLANVAATVFTKALATSNRVPLL